MSERDVLFPRDDAADARSFYLQKNFRALLDAMARPGELTPLSTSDSEASSCATRAGLLPQTVCVLDVVLDAGTTVRVAGARSDDATCELGERTHALARPLGEAAFCVVPLALAGEDAAAAVRVARAGTLASPHLGATCIVECAALLGTDASGVRVGSRTGSAGYVRWSLAGPGIDGSCELGCDRDDVLAARNARADEFPLGIDLVLVDGAGHIACVPRSTRLTRMGTSGEEVRSWAM